MQFDDITEKEDYKSEYYEIVKSNKEGKKGLLKRKAQGKRIEFEEFVFYTKGDYRDNGSYITEEKSGVKVGTLGNLKCKEQMDAIREGLAEHYKSIKPVVEYEEYETEEVSNE